MPNFLSLDELSNEALRDLIDTAIKLKASQKVGQFSEPFKGKHLAMIFEKPSTRTRVSFEVGFNQLGGKTIILDSGGTQLGRGETVADTARVLSRYVDIIMIRCYEHDALYELAEHADVPVINGLTNFNHPCQIMADIMTFFEHKGDISGKTVAWIGDGNNVTTSWIHAAAKFGFTLNIASPEKLKPDAKLIKWANQNGGKVHWMPEPEKAVHEADLVTTDTWVSMGDEDEELRRKLLDPYQVNDTLMKKAKNDAIFMHCLPAHRNEEVTDSVIDGKQSVVFDEAENRLHIQKAVMLWCLES